MTEKTQDKSALVLFSGGQDSATCLAWALERFDHVETLGFYYGQRHDVEMQARLDVRAAMAQQSAAWKARLGEDHTVDIAGYGALAESALTADRAIEMQENGLPSTFVPGRNLVFLTIASALAYRRGHGTMVGGMCETDYSGYPDCRQDTLSALQNAISLGLDETIEIVTPLMFLDKGETWALAYELGGDALVELIRSRTHTCYTGDRSRLHDWGYGCGACPACELREKGWQAWREKGAA
ncbi:7-cyano-7-deazaguanine synthase QueC [Maricaulis sp.]|uniref:7-cyano-7-deazaguanine synthase QueC n=1 Tax=Maricaulis sp. TaxID=1486257 RepID=UPI001B1DBC8A|nr:7-cyano-7-deazaguanine synthase QueC [Maricaulis sp.]MBO6797327.1 7-cyano-7-deazaguanine synthase QueC [Maricaulis sp.]